MRDKMEIANEADMIVNGYAYSVEGSNVKVLNLNMMDKAAFMTIDGEILETSMDDIEIDIMLDYYKRNREFMED